MPLDPTIPADMPPGFVGLMGLELGETSPERVVASIEIGDRHRQPYGIVHGGVYCAMAETVASMGAAMAAGEGRGSVGQSNHTDFLRATREGRLTATAVPVHVGRAVQLWSVDIVDDEGRMVAQSKVRMFNVDG